MKEDIKEQEIQELHKKISDLERSLKKLRKFEKTEDSGFQSKELEIVFDHLPDATFVINCKGKVIAWNPAIEKMTGVKATQIIGKNNYEYSIPFYGTRRPILIDLIFKMEEEIRKHHYNKIRKNRTALTAETILTKNGENIHLWCKASPIYDIDGKLIGAIESIRDITDIKREEKELKESKLLYEILLDSPGDSIFLMDYDGNIVMVNESVAKRFGYTKEDMIGKNIKELLDPELVKSRRKYLRKVFETNEKVEFEDKRNGRSYHNWIYPLDEGEGLDKVAVFSQDITQRKKTEKAVHESEEKYRMIFENCGVPMMFIDEDSTISMVNHEFEKETGYTRDEIEGKMSFTKIIATKEDKRMMLEYHRLRRIDEDYAPESYEFLYQDKTGNVKEAITRVTMEPKSKKSLVALMDITEQKRSEYALQESIERFSQVVENAEEWIWEIDTKGLYTYSNPTVEKITGYHPEEIVGKKYFYDFFKPEEREDKKRTAFNLFKKKKAFHSLVNSNIHKNGDEIFLETSGVPIFDENNTFKGYRGVDNNITERKIAVEKLHRSEERFRALAESAVDSILTTDIHGKIILFNDSLLESFGYKKDEIQNQPVTLLIPDRLRDKFEKRIMKFQSTGQHSLSGKTFLSTGLRKDGTEFPFEMSLSTWESEGEKYNTSIIRDITERKEALEAIRESELKFRNMVETTPNIIWEIDKEGVINYISPQCQEILGYSAAELTGQSVLKMVQPDFIPEAQKLLKNLVKQRSSTFEVQTKHKNGKTLIIEIRSVKRYDNDGQFIGYQGVARDITENKSREEKLQQSQNQLKIAMDLAKLVYWEHDVESDMFIFDDHFYSLYGTTQKSGSVKMSPKEYAQRFIPAEFGDLFETGIEKGLKSDDPYYEGQVEHPIIREDGEKRYILVKCMIVKDENGQVIKTYGANQDITERVEAERNIKDQAELLNLTHEAIFVHGLDSKILFWNKGACEMYGWKQKEVLGKSSHEILKTKFPEPLEDVMKKVRDDGYWNGELVHNTRKGDELIVNSHWTLKSDEDGNPVSILELNSDITHQKMVENEIKASLQQKKLLLQEIHHRVKNNLQIISSLLNLQESYVEDDEALNVLQESQNRVLSMAMIHEMLYDSKDLSTVNFSSYIQNLVYDLFNSYGINTSNVNLHLKVDEIHLNIETAVPCGLIISELVSNCLKYAFPEKCGNLNIDFHPRDLDEFELIIEDDGIGLPEDMNYKNTDSLGLRLVNSLVEQLDGSIELDKSHGTKFIIRFKELKYKKRI